MKELLVRAQHRETRDAKIGRQPSSGGKPLTRTEAAIENGAAKSVIDLSVNWNGDVTVDGEMQSGHAEIDGNGDGESTSLPDIR